MLLTARVKPARLLGPNSSINSMRAAQTSLRTTDVLEMPGIEPGASYMQSMRSTTELHPRPEHCDRDLRNETGMSSFASKVFAWQRPWILMKSLDKMYSNKVEMAHERVMSHQLEPIDFTGTKVMSQKTAHIHLSCHNGPNPMYIVATLDQKLPVATSQFNDEKPTFTCDVAMDWTHPSGLSHC